MYEFVADLSADTLRGILSDLGYDDDSDLASACRVRLAEMAPVLTGEDYQVLSQLTTCLDYVGDKDRLASLAEYAHYLRDAIEDLPAPPE